MTHGFKVGDRVQVVRPVGQSLPLGSVQTVYATHARGNYVFVYFSKEDVDASKGWDIDRFIKYEEKEQPMKIDMNKKYRLVGTHEPVRVICVDRKAYGSSLPCVGLCLTIPNVEGMVYFDHSGVDQHGQKIIEEVPAVDWSKVEIDTLIWVNGRPRYFAKYSDYTVYYFTDGTTSKTNVTGVCVAFSHNCSLEEPK